MNRLLNNRGYLWLNGIYDSVRLRTIRGRRSDVVLSLCFSFLLGLVLARRHVLIPGWVVLATGVIFLLSFKQVYFRILAALLVGVSLGVWRGTAYLQALQPYQDYARQKVTLQARVTQDAVYGKNGQLSFEIKKVVLTKPVEASLPGVVRVSGFGELAVYRGDIVQITGKLYPTRGGKQATMSYTQIKRIGSHQTPIDSFRRAFAAGMQTALPEPHASFGLGLLIGQRSTLPDTVSQAFLMVGLTHIVAVSGYNLTVLIEAARRLFGKKSKQLTVFFAVGMMVFFLFVTGASPSIVRAAVVSGLGLAAWYYGRRVRPLVLILLAGALTAYATPTYVWSDIGWWLSMLAFFGILVVAPRVLTGLYEERKVPLLSAMIVETLCAELMTMPLVLWVFGQVSLVSILANLLVALFIPIAMLTGFIAAIAGMVAPLYAGWFAWPAELVLTYMLDMTVLLSRVPHAFQTNLYLSTLDMVICYAAIGTATMLMYRKRRVWFSGIKPNPM